MAFDQLHTAIMALPDTGAAGFEGFVRDALAELTGQAFRLMKSGPQGGVDSIGDPSGSGLVIGMEGKQYATKTPLGLDALKSKLRDAAKHFPAMDLWLLATTRPIDGGNARALDMIGEELGVDVLVLDWSDTGAVPPPLAVICAATPAAVNHHLGPSVAADIAAIASNPYFESEVDRLRTRLRNPTIGLAAARIAVRNWAIRQMQDPASARVAFDSYASLEAPDTVRVDRPAVQQSLDAWWQNGPAGPAAVLGQEGMGKTWAVLSWWLARSAEAENFPLTLVIPARDVSSIDGPELLAAALHQATGVRDPSFWARRLERWLSSDGDGPLLLVAIDGLNQNWPFQLWSDLLLSLNTAERRGKVAVMLTCRPEHWKRQLKELADSRLAITTVDVPPFNDPELDALLAAHGLEREGLHPKLIDLMRVPRLSGVAIERRGDIQEGGEITPERLIYEDWRYRHHGAQRAMSHEEFRAFIGRLGRDLDDQLGGTVERKELFERLSTEGLNERDQLEAIFSELTEGGWLEPSTEAGRFKLDAGRVPAALGLALLDDMRRGASPEQRGEILGQLLDPLQGSDLSVAILRNATAFAVLDSATSTEVKVELLKAWLQSQNFLPLDFESYWRLIGLAPSLFIRVAENEWFDERAGRSDEVLVKGFANAIKWPEVAAAVEAKLLEWFSRYWLDKLEGEVLGRVENDESAQARRRESAQRAAAAESEGVAAAFGTTLQEVDPAGQAWGSYRATELLSWLPRAPLLKVFTAWALSRAILGGFRQFEALAWVLRWNTEDPVETETAILARARELLAGDGEIARSAARSLLDAIATPAARRLHDEHFVEPSQRGDDAVTWPEIRSERVEKRPLSAALSLEAEPVNPDIELPPEYVSRLQELAARVPDDALLDSGSNLARTFGRGVHALARWAPEALADLARRRSSAALDHSRLPKLPGWTVRAWKAVAFMVGQREPRIELAQVEWLPASFLTLGDDHLERWAAISRKLEKCGAERPYELQLTALAGRPASEQVKELRHISPPGELATWVKRLLNPATRDVVESLAGDLAPTQSAEALIMWIEYLRAAALDAIPTRWAALVALIGHEHAKVRAATFRLIHQSGDRGLAQSLEESGWTWSEGMDRNEAAYGSLALTLSPAAEAGEIAGRVHPEILGSLAELYPGQRVYLDGFAEHVRKELDLYNSNSPRTYPRALMDDTGGWDLLIEEYRDGLLEWTKPFVDGTSRHLHWFIMEEFPVIRALEAVDAIRPGSKAQVIGRSLREMATSNFRSGDLYRQAATLVGPAGEEARHLVLAEANDDAKLFDLAVALQESGQTDWLLDQIEDDLKGDTAGMIARGLTLAGFLQPTSQTAQLWEDRLAEPPASGWLADVHRTSRSRYRRYAWSQHWNQLFRAAVSDDVAFGAYELFLETIDGRLFAGDDRPPHEEFERWEWRRRVHWSVGWERIRSAAKAEKDKLSKEFLGSKPPLSNQSPRRR